jgi:small multidrug resistance family-3 protein
MTAETSTPAEAIDLKENDDEGGFNWTAVTILQSIAIFILAGIAEIIGGWLIWVSIKGVRDADGNIHRRPWYYALVGSLVLVAYGYIPCLQPSASLDGFGRIYAAYGGYFIVLSFLLAWALEGESAKPDLGDLIGGGISLVGVFIIMFWPGR